MTRRTLFAIISGLVLVFAFPPYSLGFLAWFAFVPLFFALEGASRKEGFATGLLSGFVFYLGAINWVTHSMYNYGGVPAAASAAVMLALVLYLSVYTGLFGLFFTFTSGADGILKTVFAGALWVGLEYIRGHFLTGFPWALLGYTQVPYLPLIQIADMTGVWGVSFLVISANAVLFIYIRAIAGKARMPSPMPALVAAAMIGSVVTYGAVRINQFDREIPYWGILKVGVAQGSIDQSLKWDRNYQNKTFEIYRELSLKAAAGGAKLIIWPETAVPFYFDPEKVRDGALGEILRRSGSYLLTGSPSYNYNLDESTLDYFNSAYLLSPEGDVLGRYDKTHLVPFGEYVPLKRFLPFVHKLTDGVGDFKVGPGPVPILFNGIGLGTLVCFESIFPEIAAGSVKNGAAVLVNITNDAWFGKTAAPYQHFQMSVMRAVENKVYLIRSANTGISAVVDPAGRIRKSTSLFEKDVFTETVGIRKGPVTFYSQYGDVFAWGCLAIASAFVISRYLSRRRNV